MIIFIRNKNNLKYAAVIRFAFDVCFFLTFYTFKVKEKILCMVIISLS